MPATRSVDSKDSLLDQCKVLMGSMPKDDAVEWAETVLVQQYNRIREHAIAAGCEASRLPVELPLGRVIGTSPLKPQYVQQEAFAPVRSRTLLACAEQLRAQIEALL